MGSGRWDPAHYRAFSSSTVGKATDGVDGVFDKAAKRISTGAPAISKDLDPLGVAVRESRDSALNPASTPLIVALDVTGSMGVLADEIARTGLGVLFDEVLKRKPIPDPHLMFMGVGDFSHDRHPLQVSQFEADARIIDQLTDLYLEHGGGGNSFESYNAAWYFAAIHTAHDSIEKRGKRGYLFTVGDEEAPEPIDPALIKRFIGDTPERSLSNAELLEMVGRMYNVFHVIVEEGSHARAVPDRVRRSWTSILGQRAIPLADYTKLSHVIVSTIEVTEGRDKDEVAGSWDGSTAVVVAKAVRDLAVGGVGGSSGVVAL